LKPAPKKPKKATTRKKSAERAPPPRAAQGLVTAICRALDDKKAEDLRILDVGDESTITDFLILATGNSDTHLRALRIEVERVLKETNTRVVGEDDRRESGWTVIDAFDVMVHLFTAEKRKFFGLEKLWRDAREVTLAKLLTPAKPKAKSRAK
jgi:ribosome-associated protein